jgi:hypothetical protein
VTDIVERLRAGAIDMVQAADEIERLRADKDVQRSQDRNVSYERDILRLEDEIKRGPQTGSQVG